MYGLDDLKVIPNFPRPIFKIILLLILFCSSCSHAIIVPSSIWWMYEINKYFDDKASSSGGAQSGGTQSDARLDQSFTTYAVHVCGKHYTEDVIFINLRLVNESYKKNSFRESLNQSTNLSAQLATRSNDLNRNLQIFWHISSWFRAKPDPVFRRIGCFSRDTTDLWNQFTEICLNGANLKLFRFSNKIWLELFRVRWVEHLKLGMTESCQVRRHFRCPVEPMDLQKLSSTLSFQYKIWSNWQLTFFKCQNFTSRSTIFILNVYSSFIVRSSTANI